MNGESEKVQSLGATEMGNATEATEAPEIEPHRRPLISDEDWAVYNFVLAQIRKDEEEEPHPGKTDIKGFTRAADIDEFTRTAEEARTYSIVSSAIDEAQRINVTRDIAIKFELDPDSADNPVVQIDLKIAEDLCNELGLDGKTVIKDDDKLSALKTLIRTEIQTKEAAREVTTAKAALTGAQDDLHVKESVLAGLQGEQVAGRHALVKIAKSSGPSKTSPS